MDAKLIIKRIQNIRAGERFVYHTGHLATEIQTMATGAKRMRDLRDIRNAAMGMFYAGRAALVQDKNPEAEGYDYIIEGNHTIRKDAYRHTHLLD